jgi:hypothetical protein
VAYTTSAKVKTMFRDIRIEAATGDPETETAVTTETVDELILEHDSFIDAKLNDFYTTPITGTASLVIVGRISKLLVAHDIKMILESVNQTSDKKQDVQGNLRAQALKTLNSLIPTWDSECCEWVDPDFTLTDASPKEQSPKSAALFKSNSGTVTIKKGGNNW